jgi:hypothetical protein
MFLLKKKLLPFLVLFLFVMGCTEDARRKIDERIEAEAREKKAVEARKALVNQLIDEYDIPSKGLCIFTFYTSGAYGKTLNASACRIMGNRTALPEDILTPANIVRLKNAGFEKLELSQRDGSSETVEIK